MKTIKGIVLIIILLTIGTLGLIAQIQMDRSLFSSAGGSVLLSAAQVDYSLGEFIIGFHQTESITLHEGFHQGQNDDLSTAQKDLQHANIAMEVFPNPTSRMVHLASKDDDLMHISIYDQLGQLVRHIELERGSRIISIDMQKLTPGIYFARLITTKLPSGTTVKLIKQ